MMTCIFQRESLYITKIILWRLQNIRTIQMYCRKTTIGIKETLLQKIALFLNVYNQPKKSAALSS